MIMKEYLSILILYSLVLDVNTLLKPAPIFKFKSETLEYPLGVVVDYSG